MAETPQRKSTGIQSLETGMALLKILADAGAPIALGALSANADMPRGQVHKYLTSLVRAGFVVQTNAGGTYDLGPEALNLGLAAMRRLDVISMGQDVLDDLRDRLGQSASMAVWVNRGPTIVRWAENPAIVSSAVKLGTVFPVLPTTVGLIFAAHLDRRITEPFIRSELEDPAGIARMRFNKMSDVETQLAKVRKNGAIAGNSIVAPGISTISAPVFAGDNRLVAVISVAGIPGRIELSLNGEPARTLIEACRQFSCRLGYSV